MIHFLVLKTQMGTNLLKSVPIRPSQDYLLRRQATVIEAGCLIRTPVVTSCIFYFTLVVQLNGLRFNLSTVHSGSLQIPSRTER